MELLDNKYIEISNGNNLVQINDSFKNWTCDAYVNRVTDIMSSTYNPNTHTYDTAFFRKNGFYDRNTVNKFFFYYNGNVYCTQMNYSQKSSSSKCGVQVFGEKGDIIFDSESLYVDIVDYLCIENMLELESSKIYTYQFPVMILAPIQIYRTTIRSLFVENIPFVSQYNVRGYGQTEAFYPEFSSNGASFSINKMRFNAAAFFEYMTIYNRDTERIEYIEPWKNPHLSDFMRDNIRHLRGYSTRTTKDLYLIVAKIPQALINIIQKYYIYSI